MSSAPPSARRVLHLRRPSLRDRRGEAHLLVWGELAQWMVVDGELLALLEQFDGKRTLKQVLRRHAKKQRRPAGQVQREAGPIVSDLLDKGVLHDGGEAPALAPEPLSIANVTVNLTNHCNLRCSWCYNDERRGGPQAMPAGALMDALEQGREVLAPDASLIILGGEPTLELPRLLEVLDRGGQLFSPRPLVSTNGTLLTDETVAQLASRRLELQVSLDSHLPQRHDAIRGPGVYHEALAGVRRVVRAGVHVILSMVYGRDSVQDFEPYLELALELGAREARFIPMRRLGRGSDVASERGPDQAEAFAQLLQVLQRRPELRPLLLRDYFSITSTIMRFSAPRSGCGVGRRVILIDADGTVYPCPNHAAPEHACGNLQHSSLPALLHDSPVMQAMRRRYHVDRYTRCRRCPFRHWCAGDCRGEVLAITGDPADPSPHCEQLRLIYQQMLWLIADGDQSLGMRERLQDGQRVADQFRV